MAGPTSVEQLVNMALAGIGWKDRIGSMREGTVAARVALDLYGPCRDALLRSQDWAFAQRSVSLTLLKSAPINDSGGATYIPATQWNPTDYPPLGYLYEYAYPDDCLKLRTVRSPVIFLPNFSPQPNQQSIANDNTYTPPRKVILCNIANAVGVYTGLITDMATWEAMFVQALVDDLGKQMAPALARLDQSGLETTKLEAARESGTLPAAAMEQG